MKKQTLFLIVLLVSTCFTLVADEPKNPEAQLSEAGIRRLEGNKQIISKNIETIKTNIQNCQSNVATLEKQEAEISNVESELLKLKDQYESFLSKAQAESKKNSEALAKLANPKDRKLASPERLERENWAKDTSEKVAQVKKLVQKLGKDLAGVQIHRKDTLTQKNHWLDRQKYHEKMLEGLNTKLDEIQKKIKG